MLESIIFHFVFVFFVLGTFVWWLLTKRKLDVLKQALLPLLLKEKMEFSQDRSLVVRTVDFLEAELANLFQCKVQIEYKFSQTSFILKEKFLLPLCFLLEKKIIGENKNFLLEDNLYSPRELLNYLCFNKKLSRLIFMYDNENYEWKVRVEYAKS